MADTLAELYAKIPAIACKGLCTGACGPVPVHPVELLQIRKAAGRRVRAIHNPKLQLGNHMVLKPTPELVCVLLKKGRCTIYKDRPLICRLFGVSQGLPCSFGCIPERWLTDGEVEELIRQLSALRPG